MIAISDKTSYVDYSITTKVFFLKIQYPINLVLNIPHSIQNKITSIFMITHTEISVHKNVKLHKS